MRLIVAGGRGFEPTPEHEAFLIDLIKTQGVTEIVSGKASGADKWGEDIAAMLGLPVKSFPADWKKYAKRGRKNPAGNIRNTEMALYANAAVVFPGGAGSSDMVKKAKAKKIDGKKNRIILFEMKGLTHGYV